MMAACCLTMTCPNTSTGMSETAEQRRIRYNYNNRIYRAKAKQDAVEFMGGKCTHCQGVFHFSAFDFHHTDPTQKDVDPGNLIRAAGKRLYDELAKCMLLCANCHRIYHYTEANLDTPIEVAKQSKLTVEYNGESKTLTEWAMLYNMKYETLRARLNEYGWSVEKALTTPVIVGKPRRKYNGNEEESDSTGPGVLGSDDAQLPDVEGRVAA